MEETEDLNTTTVGHNSTINLPTATSDMEQTQSNDEQLNESLIQQNDIQLSNSSITKTLDNASTGKEVSCLPDNNVTIQLKKLFEINEGNETFDNIFDCIDNSLIKMENHKKEMFVSKIDEQLQKNRVFNDYFKLDQNGVSSTIVKFKNQIELLMKIRHGMNSMKLENGNGKSIFNYSIDFSNVLKL